MSSNFVPRPPLKAFIGPRFVFRLLPSSSYKYYSFVSFSQFLPDQKKKMAESNNTMESLRKWVVEHKLRTVGCLWLSGLTGSIAYNWSQPNMKTSVRIIHARLHAQALTLAALAGAAVVEYYDHKSGAKADRYAKFLPPMEPHHHHKD